MKCKTKFFLYKRTKVKKNKNQKNKEQIKKIK